MRLGRLLLTILFILTVLNISSLNAFASDDNIKVVVNGLQVKFDAKPRIINNRIIVPMRGVFDKIPFEIKWDEGNKTVSAYKGGRSIMVRLNDSIALVDGKEVTLEVSAVNIDNRVFVPLRFISESIGASVEWDSNSRVVSISTPGIHIKGMDEKAFNNNTSVSYYSNSYVTCASKDNIIYSSVGTKLKKSSDNGVTWSEDLINIKPDYFTVGHIMEDDSVIMFTNGGYIYRSIDGVKFEKVDTSNLGFIYSPLYHGIDSHGNTVIAGEYSVEDGKTYRVIRSFDGGASWEAVLAKKNPDEIRHFHSVNYINSMWFITSGDYGDQVKWWRSYDDGASWEQIKNIGGQTYRTLNLQKMDGDEIIWGSDEEQFPRILKASLNDLENPVVLKSLKHACWGIVGSGNTYIAITSVESNDAEKNSYIYISRDGGATWSEDLVWPIENGRVFGGFRGIRGPDNLNQYLLSIYGLKSTKDNNVYTVIMGF
ncbi:MAG TPA: stalk domain-containing protein [Clostridia bacterium]